MNEKMSNIKKVMCWLVLGLFIPFFSPDVSPADYKKENEENLWNSKTRKNFLFDSKNDYMNEYKVTRFKQLLNLSNLYLNPFSLFPQVSWNPKKLPAGIEFPPVKPKKRWGRTILWGLGHFAYSTSSYWIRQEVMWEDWEYHFTWEDQKRRIFQFQGVRFDSNSYSFNWTHSIAGGMYYNYARINHLNKLESLAFDFACSFLWETLVEFKEVISINDMIMTPMGGISFGEATYQLGRYFRSQRPTFMNKVARILSNPIMALDQLFKKKRFLDEYAFEDGNIWSDVRLTLGPRFDTLATGNSNSCMRIGFDSQIITLPGYGEPGASGMYTKDTLATEFNLGFILNKKGVYEVDIFAKSVLFGYFSQNIRAPSHEDESESNAPSSDENVGYSLFVGAASALDINYNAPEKLPVTTGESASPSSPDKADKYAIIGLLGPTFDLSLFRKNFRLRFSADAYPDFALIHSHAFKNYSALNDVGITKCILQEHGYYYGLGLTVASALQLNYSHLEIKGKFKYHHFVSIDGRDRYQKDITPGSDFDLKDSRLIFDLSLGYQIPNSPLQLVVGLERIDRRGVLENFKRSSSERRSYIQVKYLL